MAKELIRNGYHPIIFSANVWHGTNESVEVEGLYTVKERDGIIFVVVKTPPYTGNGIGRIRNMLVFYRNVKKVMKKYLKSGAAKPDIILASQVHPLTCVAGIWGGKKFKVPCIVEIRDLWPETFVSMGVMKEKSMAASMMYCLEKYLYRKADAVLFTMKGGAKYICDRKWDKAHGGPVDLTKVFHINNGIDLKAFEENVLQYPSDDADLKDKNYFNLVYTGTIRRVNNIDMLLDIAKELKTVPKIRFLLWGGGNYVEFMKGRIQKEEITNVRYKGVVEKKEIPGILEKSDVNVMNSQNLGVHKYGVSLNKLFEYLAAGRPIFSTEHVGYSIISKYNCGLEAEGYTPKECAAGIKKLYDMSQEEREEMGSNAKEAARKYDFAVLTNKLIKIIESL